jgi:dihydrofolate reductase
MTQNAPKLTAHMVSSVDGYIAKPDGSVSWLETSDTYDKGAAGENVEEFLKTIGCYVMGSRTYEHALELSRNFGWAYGDVPTFVLTHRNLPSVRKSVEFHSGDLKAFVHDKLRANYKSIWLVGGAALIRDFVRLGLVDDIRQTIVPILLGGGTLFYDPIGQEQALHLKNVTAYKNGMVELWYEVKK